MSETLNEYLCNVGDESVFLRITPEASALRKRLMHFTLQKLKKRISYVKSIYDISPLSDTCIKCCLII